MTAPEPRPVLREGVFPWLPWPLRAMPWWTTPIRAERLAMLRIGLAFFLLLDVLLSYWPNRRVFFGPDSLGTFENYEWYSQDGRRWWSILRGPNEDLNFTIALFAALALAVWLVLDTRTRWLGDDPNPPRPSIWLPVTFAILSGIALSGYWVRILRNKEVALDSSLRTWMWLLPLLLTCYAILVWAAEAWVTYRPPAEDVPKPRHRYLTAWYAIAWGFFPLLVVAGFLLKDGQWTELNDGNFVRTLLEPWMLSHVMIAGSMLVWMIALLCLLAGFQTRLAAVAAWVLSTSFANVQPQIDNAGDTIRGIILFYLMLCPCGRAWSLDSLLARRRRPPGTAVVVSPWAVNLLFIQLVFIYFMNGAYKVFTKQWREGASLYYVLNDLTLTRMSFTQVAAMLEPIYWFFTRIPWLGDLLPDTEPAYQMTRFLTWSVLVWELTFPVMVLWKWTRVLALFFGAGFHIGIGLSMDLGFFSAYALCIYLPLLPWEKLADRWRRKGEGEKGRGGEKQDRQQ